MSTPAMAIGWTIWRRHRRGLTATVVCVAVVVAGCATARAILDPGEALSACGMIAVPLTVCALYLAAVFAYGFDTDLATAGTAFPVRMFTLPVRTTALAAWPMAYGAVVVGLLWLITAGVILRPAGLDVPLWWPALVAAAQLAWVQALVWWPFGLAWLRVLVGMLVAHIPVTGTMLAQRLDLPEWATLAFLGVAYSIGLLAAWVGVARARRGVVPSWRWLSRVGASFERQTVSRTRFGSAGRALAWFEFRRHGRTLPLLTAVMVPLCLLPLFLDENTPPIVLRTLGLALLVPVFFAGMAGTTVGRNNPWVREYYGVSSFAATRPVTTAAMVAAKVRAAGRTTLVAWGVTIGMVAAALVASGTHRALGTMLDAWRASRPAAEVAATLAVAIVLLVILTWKRAVDNLLIGLTGREWVIKGSLFAGMLVAFNAAFLVLWLLIHPEYHGTVRTAVPWAMASLGGLKLGLGTVAICALRRRRLAADRTLLGLGGIWLATFAILVAVLAWVIPADMAPAYTVGLGVLLVMPFARLSAMPLALDWNRHR